jgi:hypothetical protein
LNPPETLAAVYQHLLIVDYQNWFLR